MYHLPAFTSENLRTSLSSNEIIILSACGKLSCLPASVCFRIRSMNTECSYIPYGSANSMTLS